VGSYDLTVNAYRYSSQTKASISVTDAHVTAVDFALTPVPSVTVSGTVTDGSGHGWPVYSEIVIDGYPEGSIFSDPNTGKYAVQLPRSSSFAFHVTPVYQGYHPITQTVSIAGSDVVANFAPEINATTCVAPGYGWNGTPTAFTGWTAGAAQDGWAVTGTRDGWRFDDPGNRQQPPGGESTFAIADSAYYGSTRLNTTLTSPASDLSAQDAPVLSFSSRYIGSGGAGSSAGTVELSTNNGKTWSPLWRQTTSIAAGTVSIDLAAAAHHTAVRVRFGFAGRAGGYWAIDNVFVGTRTCVAQRGGLLIGAASDAGTHADLPGVRVYCAADPANASVTVATPDDATTSDGFYWLFSPAGPQTFTASRSGYVTASHDVTITAEKVSTYDWTLAQ
jgi:hypothetical protein